MEFDRMNLGERIMLAARMAVAMHLEQSESPQEERRITAGGTGLDEVTEDVSPLGLDWARGFFPAPSPRSGQACHGGKAA